MLFSFCLQHSRLCLRINEVTCKDFFFRFVFKTDDVICKYNLRLDPRNGNVICHDIVFLAGSILTSLTKRNISQFFKLKIYSIQMKTSCCPEHSWLSDNTKLQSIGRSNFSLSIIIFKQFFNFCPFVRLKLKLLEKKTMIVASQESVMLRGTCGFIWNRIDFQFLKIHWNISSWWVTSLMNPPGKRFLCKCRYQSWGQASKKTLQI